MESFGAWSAANASHLGVLQHSEGGGGGLGLGAEAAHDADGLRHEAGVPHHRHPSLHHRLHAPDARRPPPCAAAAAAESSALSARAAARV